MKEVGGKSFPWSQIIERRSIRYKRIEGIKKRGAIQPRKWGKVSIQGILVSVGRRKNFLLCISTGRRTKIRKGGELYQRKEGLAHLTLERGKNRGEGVFSITRGKPLLFGGEVRCEVKLPLLFRSSSTSSE